MFGLTESLNYEERQSYYRAIAAAVPRMSEPQVKCLLLALLGLNQEQTGEALGMSNQAVSYNLKRAMRMVASSSPEYGESGSEIFGK